MMDLSSSVGGLPVTSPVGNSPGPLKGEDSWRHVLMSAAGFVRCGSFCLEPRDGNGGETFWQGDSFALNSLGLPCRPPLEYVGALRRLGELETGKPVIASVAGFSPDEFGQLARMFAAPADAVELNLSCPNAGHEVLAYDPWLIWQVLAAVQPQTLPVPVLVKLPPVPDGRQILEIVRILTRCHVAGVVLCNTFPNCTMLDGELRPVLTNVLGGLSGDAMFPIVLGQLVQYRRAGWEGSVIVEGGVSSGSRAMQALGLGADAVCSGTAYAGGGAKVLHRIVSELVSEMDRWGLRSLTELRALVEEGIHAD